MLEFHTPPDVATDVDVGNAAAQLVDGWGAAGIVAALMLLGRLLLLTLRWQRIDSMLDDLDAKRFKPHAAVVLGALLGGLSAYATGATIGLSVGAGILAGLAAVGTYEVKGQ